MKVFLSAFTLFSALFFLPASAEEMRIGYVDLDYVIENSYLKTMVDRSYREERSSLFQAQNQLFSELTNLQIKNNQMQSMLGYSEYMQEQAALTEHIKEKEKEVLQSWEELKNWEKGNSAQLYDDLFLALKEIAHENNMSIVLDRRHAVLYGDRSEDISQKVLDFLNRLSERDDPSVR